MTDKRILADTIARAIADQIESSRSIIVQNMADVIHDALLLDEAKPIVDPQKSETPKWGSLKNWWQDEMSDIDHAAWMQRIYESDARAAEERRETQRRIRYGWGACS